MVPFCLFRNCDQNTLNGEMNRHITIIFVLISIALLIFMTNREVIRYNENADVSSFSYKNFNSLSSDKYPAYTLCFASRFGQMFFTRRSSMKIKKRKLTDKRKLYWRIFTGQNINKILRKHDVKSEKIEEIKNLADFSSLTMDLKEIVSSFKMRLNNKILVENWELENNTQKPSQENPLFSKTKLSEWPFYVSYMTPATKCFTRKVNFQKNVIKRYEYIKLHKGVLNEILKPQNKLWLSVNIHYPQQQVRGFRSEAEVIRQKLVYNNYENMNIGISHVRVTKRRPSSNAPCNPRGDNQDDLFRKSVIEKIGCIPPYWKTLGNGNYSKISICDNSTQLENAFNYAEEDFFRTREIILGNENSPCIEMTIISSNEPLRHGSTGNGSHLTVRFNYQVSHYKETVNVQAYLFQDLLSSVGGYIGMFLGFGLLQIPEVASSVFGFVTRRIKQITFRQ